MLPIRRAKIPIAAAALALACACLPLLSCARRAETPGGRAPGRPRVAASTTVAGDIVSRVGGPDIDLVVLLKPGQDPHGYEPRAADMAALDGVDVLFVNGLGLESFLPLLRGGLARPLRIESLSEGIEPITAAGEPEDAHGDEPGHGEAHDHGGVDPHVWFDPLLVARWIDRIEAVLVELDPPAAPRYRERAAAARAELAALDEWIRSETARIPAGARRLVADHRVLGYFARRYGFEEGGVITQGFSTLAEPSARDVARLEAEIRARGVRAVFVGSTANPALARRIAADTGIAVVPFYTDALLGPEGEARSYEAMMRANVAAMVAALAPPAEAP